MPHALNFNKQKEFIRHLAKTMNRHDLIAFILSHVRKPDTEQFKKEGTEEILRMTNPCNVIPDIYHEYRQIVHDGIFFLLSHFSLPRFISLAVDQLLMKADISDQERLIGLARQIPTLHKLGQIIARNRNLDKSFRKWLIRLENDTHQTDIQGLKEKIKSEIGGMINLFSIQTGDEVLAEASVGTVIPFTWAEPGTDKRSKGVFKLLKPMIREHLKEESDLLGRLAIFFDKNRARYALKNFRFIETFNEIKEGLQKEADLLGEQSNLKKAAQFYGKENTAVIPPVLIPFSTKNMTAMKHMSGGKITDNHIGPENKKELAQMLFKAVIWQPLFSRQEQTMFHGDPHAGNIYADKEENGKINLILLDWSQAGGLSKQQRMNIFTLSIGIFLEDELLIHKAIKELSSENSDPKQDSQKTIRYIRDIFDSPQYIRLKMVEKVFFFIDQMALHGVQFPKDLLLLRKAFFTLEGILYDLDAEFDIDGYVLKLIETLCIEELPKRWIYFLFPQSDSLNHYKSLMSNRDVQELVNRIFKKCLKKGMNMVYELTEKHTDELAKFLLTGQPRLFFSTLPKSE